VTFLYDVPPTELNKNQFTTHKIIFCYGSFFYYVERLRQKEIQQMSFSLSDLQQEGMPNLWLDKNGR